MRNHKAIMLFCLVLLTAMAMPAPLYAQRRPGIKTVNVKAAGGKEDPWADYQEEKDSIPRWEAGINVGGYFANKHSAGFYDGDTMNINTVKYVMTNKYWYQDIKNLLNSSDTVLIDGYPGGMHYRVALTGGVFLRYNFNRKNGVFLEANYVQLKAEDIVTFDVDPPSYLALHDIRQIPIIGQEERAMINLGYQRSFPMKSRVYFYAQAALTMAYTHVKKSFISVEGKEFSLVNIYGNKYYVPNSNSQTFDVRQTGIGWGGMIGGGVGLPVTDMFCIEPGASMQVYPTNLEGYKAFRPNFSIYLRILFGFSNAKTT